MSEMALTTTTGGIPMPEPLPLIEDSIKAETTKRLYTRVLEPVLENDGNLSGMAALKVYAET